MKDGDIDSHPNRTVGALEIAAAVHARARQSVRLVQKEPPARFGIRLCSYRYSGVAAPPEPAAPVDVEVDAFRVGNSVSAAELLHHGASAWKWMHQRECGRVVVAVPDVAIRECGQRPA